MEKKRWRKNAGWGRWIFLMLLCACCLTGIGTAMADTQPIFAAQEETGLQETTVTIGKGERTTLSVLGNPQKVSWRVNRRSIATVSSKGVVKGVSAGTTTVIATIDGVEYKCKVRVEEPKLNKTTLRGRLGNTYVLKLTGTARKVTFSSEDSSIVRIISTGKMRFVSPGTTKVYAKVGTTSYACTVTVPEPDITIPSLAAGESKTISLGGKTYQGVTYQSSNPAVIRVDEEGTMTAVSEGSAVITVKIQKYSVKKTVNVENTLESAVVTGNTAGLSSSEKQIAKAAHELYAKAVTEEMTQIEKIRALHDAIVTSTKYDYENYNTGTIPAVSYTIEGVLIRHVAVCQGYAETMELFLNAIGVENQLITGYGASGGQWISHIWNLVKLDGDWYHIDATWDDPIINGKDDPNYIGYDYFLIDDVKMSGDHSWIEKNYPDADGGIYSTYIVDKQLEEYEKAGALLASADELEAACRERIENGQMEFTLLYPGEKQDYYELLLALYASTQKRLSLSVLEGQIGEYTVLELVFAEF